jgi:hypothetical protein
MKNAPTAYKFCDQGPKTTFATQSAQSGHRDGAEECLLLGVKRTSRFQGAMSAFPKRT